MIERYKSRVDNPPVIETKKGTFTTFVRKSFGATQIRKLDIR